MTCWSWEQPYKWWSFNINIFCVLQVLQWLIVHADTIQSLLRCREFSLGGLQELSLLTGIISKTALPGNQVFATHSFFHWNILRVQRFRGGSFHGPPAMVFQVFLKWVERSTALLAWSSRVTYTDSRFDKHIYYMWHTGVTRRKWDYLLLSVCEFSCWHCLFSFKRLCLSLLGRLAGSDRDRLWKQAEMGGPEDSPDEREEMEVALQQVGLI